MLMVGIVKCQKGEEYRRKVYWHFTGSRIIKERLRNDVLSFFGCNGLVFNRGIVNREMESDDTGRTQLFI